MQYLLKKALPRVLIYDTVYIVAALFCLYNLHKQLRGSPGLLLIDIARLCEQLHINHLMTHNEHDF